MPDFSRFDDDDNGDPTPVKPRYGNEQTKALKDGDYDVKLTHAEMKAMGKDTSDSKFVFYGVIVSDGPFNGWKCEKEILLDKKGGDGVTDEMKNEHRRNKTSELLGDFRTIGFDVENWTKANGRPRSEQIPVACDVLKGVYVKMTKRTKGAFTNVYINKRLANLDGMSPTFGEAEMAAGATASSPQAGDTMPDGSEVPF